MALAQRSNPSAALRSGACSRRVSSVPPVLAQTNRRASLAGNQGWGHLVLGNSLACFHGRPLIVYTFDQEPKHKGQLPYRCSYGYHPAEHLLVVGDQKVSKAIRQIGQPSDSQQYAEDLGDKPRPINQIPQDKAMKTKKSLPDQNHSPVGIDEEHC